MAIKVKLLVNLKIGPEEIINAGTEYTAEELLGLPDFIQYEVANRKHNVVISRVVTQTKEEGGEEKGDEEQPKRRGRGRS